MPRHKMAHKDGGYILVDEGDATKQALKEILSRLGSKLVKGEITDLLATPAPAYIHAPCSYLETICNDMGRMTTYMKKACETKDPVERLKLMSAMIIGGQHITSDNNALRSPLNPILGETCQRLLPDGTRYYAEQTSHHPPVSSFQFDGPNNSFSAFGHLEYVAFLSGVNTFGGCRRGKYVFQFEDGGLLSYKDPNVELSGFVQGEKVNNWVDSLIIKDHINRMTSEVVYNP